MTTAQQKTRRKIWASMRRLRTFTPADLEAGAEAAPQLVAHYLRMCNIAGFAKPQARAALQGGARFKPWVLLRDFGPLTPVLKGGQLVDPTLDPQNVDPDEQIVAMPREEYEHALRCVRACNGMGADPEAVVARLRAAAGDLA